MPNSFFVIVILLITGDTLANGNTVYLDIKKIHYSCISEQTSTNSVKQCLYSCWKRWRSNFECFSCKSGIKKTAFWKQPARPILISYNGSVIYIDCRSWVKPTIQPTVRLLNPRRGKKSHHDLLRLISFTLLTFDWQLHLYTTQQGNILSCVKLLLWLSSTGRAEEGKKLGKMLKCMALGWILLWAFPVLLTAHS